MSCCQPPEHPPVLVCVGFLLILVFLLIKVCDIVAQLYNLFNG